MMDSKTLEEIKTQVKIANETLFGPASWCNPSYSEIITKRGDYFGDCEKWVLQLIAEVERLQNEIEALNANAKAPHL